MYKEMLLITITICLPCDGNVWKAEAAAATRPGADLQFMSSCSLEEGFITTHLFHHHDQELKHHNGKVATNKECEKCEKHEVKHMVTENQLKNMENESLRFRTHYATVCLNFIKLSLCYVI